MPDEDDDPNAPPDAAAPAVEVPDAANPVQQKRIRNRAKFEKEQGAEFWRAMLATEIGRREIWSLLTNAHTFEDRFACGPNGFPQPEATWFQAGEKAVGMRLYLSLLKLDLPGVTAMHEQCDTSFEKVRRPRRSET